MNQDMRRELRLMLKEYDLFTKGISENGNDQSFNIHSQKPNSIFPEYMTMLETMLYPNEIKLSQIVHSYLNKGEPPIFVIANLFIACAHRKTSYKLYSECIISLFDAPNCPIQHANELIQNSIKLCARNWFHTPSNNADFEFPIFWGLREIMLHIFGPKQCTEEVALFLSNWPYKFFENLYRVITFAPELSEFKPDILNHFFTNSRIQSVKMKPFENEIKLIKSKNFTELKTELETKSIPKSLFSAIVENDISTIQRMSIEKDFDFNKTIDPNFFFPFDFQHISLTLIQCSALFGSSKSFKYLKQNNASLNFKDSVLLQCAIAGGNTSIIREIIDDFEEAEGLSPELFFQNIVDASITAIKNFRNEEYIFLRNNYKLYSQQNIRNNHINTFFVTATKSYNNFVLTDLINGKSDEKVPESFLIPTNDESFIELISTTNSNYDPLRSCFYSFSSTYTVSNVSFSPLISSFSGILLLSFLSSKINGINDQIPKMLKECIKTDNIKSFIYLVNSSNLSLPNFSRIGIEDPTYIPKLDEKTFYGNPEYTTDFMIKSIYRAVKYGSIRILKELLNLFDQKDLHYKRAVISKLHGKFSLLLLATQNEFDEVLRILLSNKFILDSYTYDESLNEDFLISFEKACQTLNPNVIQAFFQCSSIKSKLSAKSLFKILNLSQDMNDDNLKYSHLIETFQLFIDNISFSVTDVDYFNLTLLSRAILYNHIPIARLLLGLPPETNQETIDEVIDITKVKVNVNTPDSHKWTSLHYAVDANKIEFVKLLLKVPGINVNAETSIKETPLHFAVRNGNNEIIQLLIKQPSIDLNPHNWEQNCPLHYAAISGNVDCLDFFISSELIDPNQRNSDGKTPLFLAVENGQTVFVDKLLYFNKIIPLIPDNQGQIPLHIAAKKGFDDIISLLLPFGGLEQKTKDGNTPLHLAVIYGNVSIIQLLVESGADVNAIGQNSKTPLHFAATYGKKEVVLTLMKSKDLKRDVIANGMTPYMIAQNHNNITLMDLLK